ncbi:hypothetical protein VHEMI10764 [[Torrubiella] hemipterigena]|uniref:Endonuclease/exonuclease/phosphatase domain-containing protein n=1 Tax=[Torrubiella] hemipterigena TaxID=1531966 RepID=A0A0A1TSG0_9HYPO|nr:hypothetical protein VHEMI10764 [[Torrubiella] hemipterigena]
MGTTRQRIPSTIDLCFSNIPGSTATVEEHLTTGTLHHTISINIPSCDRPPPVQGRIRVTKSHELKKFSELVKHAMDSLIYDTTTHATIENLAEELTQILQQSARAAGREVKGNRPKCKTWWNQECQDACDQLRTMRIITDDPTGLEVQIARRDLHRAIQMARKTGIKQYIEDIQAKTDVYKVTRWIRPKRRTEPPPIQINDEVYETDLEKAEALRKAKLETRDASHDIHDPWDCLVEEKEEIPFQEEITIREVEDAILHTGNTTPGIDGITTAMLRHV